MIDITGPVELATRSGGDWTKIAAMRVVNNFTAISGGHVDWDEEAGESWIRVIESGNVIFYLSTNRSIAFVLAGLEIDPKFDGQMVVLVEVESFSEKSLTCERDTLLSAFPVVERFSDFDSRRFSVDDLWYSTV